MSPDIIKVAHNANFEITCLRATGLKTHVCSWECTMVRAMVLGLPAKLETALEAIEAPEEFQKTKTDLVRFFSKP